MIAPPPYAITELDEFLDDRDERLRHDFPYTIPLSPDAFHKQGVSGGMPNTVSVPATADDPPLNNEYHRTTFVKYSEIPFNWGGFPSLDRCPHHTYPIDRIRGQALAER